ncbi:MAG: hypothetical protein RIQ54_589 [Candidatus Parcubacteria bacterium]|jgi:energy-coupling factor transporter transmembrane protein EcfT
MKKDEYFPVFLRWVITKEFQKLLVKKEFSEELLLDLWDMWIFRRTEILILALLVIFACLIPPLMAATAVLFFQIGLLLMLGTIQIPAWLFRSFAIAPIAMLLITFFILYGLRLMTIAYQDENGKSVDVESLKTYIKKNMSETGIC